MCCRQRQEKDRAGLRRGGGGTQEQGQKAEQGHRVMPLANKTTHTP